MNTTQPNQIVTALAAAVMMLSAGAWGQCEEGWDDRFRPGFGVQGGRTLLATGPELGPLLSNRLFVGGHMLAGGEDVGGVVEWTGSAWVSAGLPLEGSPHDQNRNMVREMCAGDLGDGPRIFAGGWDIFGQNMREPLAQWDGQTWHGMIDPWEFEGLVSSIAIHDDGSGPALYAAGTFHLWEGDTFDIARWRDGQWEAVGSPNFRGDYFRIFSLIEYDDGTGPALYAGGFFNQIGGVEAMAVAKWDGEHWTQVGEGLRHYEDEPAHISSLASMVIQGQPRLYARGMIEGSGDNDFSSDWAVWDGIEWRDGLADFPFKPYDWKHIETENGPVFLVSGHNGGGGPVRVAISYGDRWSILPGDFDGGISALGMSSVDGSESVYVVGSKGSFSHIDDLPSDGFARFGCERCPADFDADGDADSSDVAAFLNLWLLGDIATDINRDGSVDTRDVGEFLNLWNAGC